MKLLSFKNKIHKSVNTIFYIIILGIGFIIGLCFNKIDFNKLVSQVLMIDNVSATTIYTYNGITIDEDYIYEIFMERSNHINEVQPDFDISVFPYIYCNIYNTSTSDRTNPRLMCTALKKEALNPNNLLFYKDGSNYRVKPIGIVRDNGINENPDYIGFGYQIVSKEFNSIYPQVLGGGTTAIFYTNFAKSNVGYDSYTEIPNSNFKNVLDFSKYQIPPIELDPQVNTWNGYGYDFYTNQVGILDMRKDTYIVNSHTCPNDGEFVTGYDGQTKDICSWSYYSDLSDFLVFYFNGRIYDSENVEWSNITFLKDHTYSLSFTLYGLVPQEQLYSIQFSLEGELTQEIYSSNFGKVLTDSLDSRTYLTFSITPTEDITFDHFFLKYFTNGSYAQTVGASRLWVYNDYTGLSEDAMQIIQTDKLLSQNQALKDLIENPFVNKDNVDSFWNNFKQDDFGLTQIVTLPLNTIKKISNGTCTPLNINILGKTIQLPCGDTLFWNREDIKDFKVFWNMIFGGILCYGIAISIYKDIHKAQSPMNDKLEVIDL